MYTFQSILYVAPTWSKLLKAFGLGLGLWLFSVCFRFTVMQALWDVTATEVPITLHVNCRITSRAAEPICQRR